MPESGGFEEFGTHIGVASGRPFTPAKAGGPIRRLSATRVRITALGIEVVERHLARFGTDPQNAAALQRLRRIVDGTVTLTAPDRNFYTHELREFVRYRALGFSAGQPTHPDEAFQLWNNAHTAALEDYGLNEAVGILYHLDTY
jgi:hypothetical protein